YLAISGGDGNYASTPDSVAASVTGDLDLEFELVVTNADLPAFSLDFLGDFDASVAKITAGSPTVGTFTRAGDTATRVNDQGFIEPVLANNPRKDHHPITRAVRGLLVEEARTNLCLQSEDYATTWTPTNVTIGANETIAPDGTVTADKLI